MVIKAYNPETEGLEKTYLSQTVQASSNQLKVKNADRIGANKRILIGEMGMEQSEIVTTTTGGSSTQINLSGNTQYAHTADEPIYLLIFDQVMFYRAASADGTYTLLSGGTVGIDVDNREDVTVFNDTTGTGTSFYKYKFYNSITAEESVYSDYISAEGYGEKTIGSVIDAVVKRVKDTGFAILSADDYLNIGSEVNQDISSQSERPYNFTRKFVLLDRVADQGYIDLPEDYYKFKQLEYTNTVGSYPRTKPLTPINIANFNSRYGTVAKSDYLSRVALDDEAKRILISPTPRTGATDAFQLWYYRELGDFKNPSDVVMTPNTLIYKYKFMAEFYSVKAENDPSYGNLATKYEQKYGNELMKLQRTNRKDVGTARSFMDSANTTSNTYTEGKRYHM